MDARQANDPASANNPTAVERTSDRELVVTRTFNAPAHIVFEAWTTPELLMRWWAPRSFGVVLLACEVDVRAGGAVRFVMGHPASERPMEFFGTYLEVTPPCAPRLDERGSRRGRFRHHGDLRGTWWQDGGRHARPLSVEGSARRSHGLPGDERVWRDVRAVGRAPQLPGHERVTAPGPTHSSRRCMVRAWGRP